MSAATETSSGETSLGEKSSSMPTEAAPGGVVLAVAAPSGRVAVRMVGTRPVELPAPGQAQRAVVEARARVWAAVESLLVAIALVGALVIALDLVDGVELLHQVLGRLVSRDVIRAWLCIGLGAAALRLELEIRHLAHMLRRDRQVRRCGGCRSAAATMANATERLDSCATTHRATRRTRRQAARIPGPTPGCRRRGAW